MIKQKLGSVGSLVAVLALLLAVNVAASICLRSFNADLTEEKLYTLSDGTKAILDKLDDKIKMKFFYSKKAAAEIPFLNQYADRVIELLRQYQASSGGKITVELLEPRPDTEEEEWAINYGLRSVSRFGAEDIYIGLVIVNEVGDEESIPFLSPDPEKERFLEYDITRLITSISGSDKKTIGIMSGLNILGAEPNPMPHMGGAPEDEPWAFVSEIKKQYNVKKIETTAKKIEGVDLLMVVHPKNLSDETQYAIDQYVLSGGRAIVLVDPLSVEEQQESPIRDFNAQFQATYDSDLPKLFKAWGVEMPKGKVTADLDLPTQLRMGSQVVRHPTYISLGKEQCNQDEIASADLESLIVANAGHINILEGEDYKGLVRTPLIQTSSRAGEVDAMMVKMGMDPDSMARDLKETGKPLNLAVKISGKFKTAFPGGKPAGKDETEASGEEASKGLAESSVETAVIVVSDVDMLSDHLSVRKQNLFGQTLIMVVNDNLSFMTNSAEVLMGGYELASLRTRGKSSRPFTLVDQMEKEADAEWKDIEQKLVEKEKQTREQLNELERGKDSEERAVLSKSQIEKIQEYRKALADSKKKVREVSLQKRQAIESLGTKVKMINILAMPALVVAASFLPVVWRSRTS